MSLHQFHLPGIPVPPISPNDLVEIAKAAWVRLLQDRWAALGREMVGWVPEEIKSYTSHDVADKLPRFEKLTIQIMQAPAFPVREYLSWGAHPTSSDFLFLERVSFHRSKSLAGAGFHPATRKPVRNLLPILQRILKDVDWEEEPDGDDLPFVEADSISRSGSVSLYVDLTRFKAEAQAQLELYDLQRQTLFLQVTQVLKAMGARKVELRGDHVVVSKPLQNKIRESFNIWSMDLTTLAKALLKGGRQ